VLVDVHQEPGLGGQGVAAGAGEDEVGPADGAACPVDEHLQIRRRVRGQSVGPEPLGQDVVRQEAAPPGDEDPQQGTDLATPEARHWHLGPAAQHHEPPEETELEFLLADLPAHHPVIISPGRREWPEATSH
jgi:hypothetical protein